jgi:hypothetical protein
MTTAVLHRTIPIRKEVEVLVVGSGAGRGIGCGYAQRAHR